ncbi:UDP-glucuronosyltransferase-like [Ostrinia furnacalis]|uniref:UDP-glucuronosyltransferase-like n=1 Tax=Ostrinia furnacalis TaxID=93504 RepID=UPI001038BBD4|nr:UDP-glucuronosyltransferase-like [Ostrinia furnacalis]
MSKEINMKDLAFIKSLMISLANATLTNPNVKRLMEDPAERFDAVIAEWMYTELFAGFAAVFNCPLIWFSSMDPQALVLRLIDGTPSPAYFADPMSAEHPPFDFGQRINGLWLLFRRMKLEWSTRSIEDSIYNSEYGPAAAIRGITLPSLTVMRYNASLMLGNSHISMGQSISLPQNYKEILGYHIADKVQPLPDNIKKILDGAKHGVIYFSMGSMLKSTTFPEALKRELLDMFRGFKQTVLWKFEDVPPKLPVNVHVVKWAPQQDVLAHPNCVLFITHGGLLSITETIHHAVPIIGIPMFADQFLNINRAVRKGFGIKVSLDWDLTKNLKSAIEEILRNSSYQEKVKEVSFVYHHRPTPPGAELVHWVEHVVKTRGALHLRSPALNVAFYQKMYLDLVAVVVVVLVVVVKVVKSILKLKKGSEKSKEKQR